MVLCGNPGHEIITFIFFLSVSSREIARNASHPCSRAQVSCNPVLIFFFKADTSAIYCMGRETRFRSGIRDPLCLIVFMRMHHEAGILRMASLKCVRTMISPHYRLPFMSILRPHPCFPVLFRGLWPFSWFLCKRSGSLLRCRAAPSRVKKRIILMNIWGYVGIWGLFVVGHRIIVRKCHIHSKGDAMYHEVEGLG